MTNHKIFTVLTLAVLAVSAQAAVTTNWLSDPGFEGLLTSTEPETNSSPWYTNEGGKWDLVRNGSIVNSDSYSVRFTYFGTTPYLRQEMPAGLTVDSNATYEVSFYMRLDEAEATNPGHTNYPAKVQVDIDTSATHGGTYVK